jgi:hypothetical protein
MTKESVVEKFSASAIDQRQATKQLMSLGLNVVDSYQALGIISGPLPTTHDDLTAVDAQVGQIEALASHPLILGSLSVLDSLPPDAKTEEAERFIAKFSDPEFLTQLGLDPAGRRLSLRVFEKPFNNATEAQDITLAKSQPIETPAGGWTVCGSCGFIGCVSVGKEL